MWSWLFLCSFGLFGAITPSHFHFLPLLLTVHSERKWFCRQQDQFVCSADSIETREKSRKGLWEKSRKGLWGLEVSTILKKLIWVMAWSLRARQMGTQKSCISHWGVCVPVRREHCESRASHGHGPGCLIGYSSALRVVCFLLLPLSYLAGQRMPHC